MAGTHTGVVLLTPASSPLFTPPWPTPYVMLRRTKLRATAYDGFGQVVGTVHVKGVPNFPVRRRVRLFRDRDAICVGETWSDPDTGAYLFVGVDPTEKYTALAYDYERNYRGVVADNLTPDPYP